MMLLWFWRSYAIRPIHLLGGLGCLFIALSALFGLRTVYLFFLDQSLHSTLEPLLTVFTFITGLLLLSLGIVTDILIKIYYAVTDKSYYSVREVKSGGDVEQVSDQPGDGASPEIEAWRPGARDNGYIRMTSSSEFAWRASNTVGICAFPLSKGHSTGRGLERVVAELVAALDRLGQTHAFYERGVIRNELAAVGLASSFWLDLLGRQHDIWFGVYPVAGIFPILARKRPVVTGVYDLIPFLSPGYDNALKYSIKRRCIEFSCRFSDGLIVPFSSTAKQITEMFGVVPDQIEVIPLGIDHTRFYLDQNIPKRKMRIGFLGEAKRAKGLDTAIVAFAQVSRLIPEAFLVIASDGNEIEDMKRLARDMLPAGRYEFVEFVPEADMRRFYSELDLFLFPSRYGFGMSPVEAAACGTPAMVPEPWTPRTFLRMTSPWLIPTRRMNSRSACCCC